MADEKKNWTIYPGEALRRAVAERDDSHGRSGLIDAIAARYAEVCRRERPELRPEEWGLIFDTLNGTILWDHPGSVALIWAEVEDAIRLNHYDAKWGVGPGLPARFKALTYAQLVAVADAAERFWADTRATEEQLRERGIPVPKRNAELADRLDAERIAALTAQH